MSFKTDFPELFQFFAGYFPDADFENISDKEIVSRYINDCNEEQLNQTKTELSKLTNNLLPYWQEVSQEANRYFHNKNEALTWIEMIKKEIKGS